MNSELNKLRWQCRRGIKELDQLLVNFLEQHYATLFESEQRLFSDSLLSLEDDKLYGYFFNEETPQQENLISLVQKIRATTTF